MEIERDNSIQVLYKVHFTDGTCAYIVADSLAAVAALAEDDNVDNAVDAGVAVSKLELIADTCISAGDCEYLQRDVLIVGKTLSNQPHVTHTKLPENVPY
jgi:hypothetical protein